MPRLAKIAEVTTILALIAGTAWLGQLVQHNYVTHAESSGSAGPGTAPVDIPARTLGGVDAVLQVSGCEAPLMLFVLSTTCPFCEQKHVGMAEPGSHGSTSSVRERRRSMCCRSARARETRDFLAMHELDLPVRLVDPAVLPLLGLSGYPSTLGIDPVTRGIAAWSGCIEHRRSGRRAHMGSLCDDPPGR